MYIPRPEIEFNQGAGGEDYDGYGEEQDDGREVGPDGQERAREETQFEAYNRMQRERSEQVRRFSPEGGEQDAGRGNLISHEAHYTRTYNRLMKERWADFDDSSFDDFITNPVVEEVEEPISSEESPGGDGTTGRKRPAAPPSENQRHVRPRHEDRVVTASTGGNYNRARRPECFLCAWGNRFHDGIEAKHVNELHDIINDNYGTRSNVEIAQMLVLYYAKNVFRPRQGMVMLTREVALEHIEEMHTLNARIFLGEALQREKKNYFLLTNASYREDGSYDKIAVQEARKTLQAIEHLYLMPLSKMNFNQGQSAEDLKRAANLTQLKPNFEQRPQAPVRQRQERFDPRL
jgi:hypothetical protein